MMKVKTKNQERVQGQLGFWLVSAEPRGIVSSASFMPLVPEKRGDLVKHDCLKKPIRDLNTKILYHGVLFILVISH